MLRLAVILCACAPMALGACSDDNARAASFPVTRQPAPRPMVRPPAAAAKRAAPSPSSAEHVASPGTHRATLESPADSEASDNGALHITLGPQQALARLKLLRIQMALDKEETQALQLRLDKLKVQQQLNDLMNNASGKGHSGPTRAQRKRAHQRSILEQMIVKAVQTKPDREAIVMLRGRVYQIRPGDVIDGLQVVGISQDGLTFKTRSGRSARVSAR